MQTVVGNHILDMDKNTFQHIKANFLNVEIDIGTGDGQYIFKSADKDKKTLFVGVDPAEKQLEIYSRKSVRKKLKNALFVLGSFERFPPELYDTANIVHILFPWGSLLQSVVKPTFNSVNKIKSILHNGVGEVNIVLGYSFESEPTESARLELPDLNISYINDVIVPVFVESGFKPISLKELNKETLKNVGTTWSKKLNYGKERPVFNLRFSS